MKKELGRQIGTGCLLIMILTGGVSGCAQNYERKTEAEAGSEGSICIGFCWIYDFIVTGRGRMGSTVGEDDTPGGVGDDLLREQDGAGTGADTGL